MVKFKKILINKLWESKSFDFLFLFIDYKSSAIWAKVRQPYGVSIKEQLNENIKIKSKPKNV